MKELKVRSDIQVLVESFYQKALKDDLIQHFFNEVVQLNWEKHIPRIVDFWEMNLLGTGSFKGNPMTAHFALDEKSAMEAKHFERWVELWELSVHEHFEGELADLAIQRAKQIAQLMQFKIIQEKSKDEI